MSDLISRQAILKHIEKIRQSALMMDDIRRANIVMTGMNLGEEAVRVQPSAQPENIWCKDCGHHVEERPFEVYCNIMCRWVNEKDYCTMFEPGHMGCKCEKETGKWTT